MYDTLAAHRLRRSLVWFLTNGAGAGARSLWGTEKLRAALRDRTGKAPDYNVVKGWVVKGVCPSKRHLPHLLDLIFADHPSDPRRQHLNRLSNAIWGDERAEEVPYRDPYDWPPLSEPIVEFAIHTTEVTSIRPESDGEWSEAVVTRDIPPSSASLLDMSIMRDQLPPANEFRLDLSVCPGAEEGETDGLAWVMRLKRLLLKQSNFGCQIIKDKAPKRANVTRSGQGWKIQPVGRRKLLLEEEQISGEEPFAYMQCSGAANEMSITLEALAFNGDFDVSFQTQRDDIEQKRLSVIRQILTSNGRDDRNRVYLGKVSWSRRKLSADPS